MIDLGFADLWLLDGGSIDFVDVPGHVRLVRTMLAGAGGADFVSAGTRRCRSWSSSTWSASRGG